MLYCITGESKRGRELAMETICDVYTRHGKQSTFVRLADYVELYTKKYIGMQNGRLLLDEAADALRGVDAAALARIAFTAALSILRSGVPVVIIPDISTMAEYAVFVGNGAIPLKIDDWFKKDWQDEFRHLSLPEPYAFESHEKESIRKFVYAQDSTLTSAMEKNFFVDSKPAKLRLSICLEAPYSAELKVMYRNGKGFVKTCPASSEEEAIASYDFLCDAYWEEITEKVRRYPDIASSWLTSTLGLTKIGGAK